MKDLHTNVLVKRAISPVVSANNTALVSQIIDRQGFESLEFVIAVGAFTDADATTVVLVEDGDDAALGDNTAVDDKYLLGTEAGAAFTFANDNEVRKIGYIGNKRYVRLTITPSNNGGDLPVSAVALLSRAAGLPVTQTAA